VTLDELRFQALMARDEDDYAAAESLLEEVIQIEREWGYRASMILNVAALGDIARRRGDCASAGVLLAEAAALARDVGMKLSGCWSIEAVAKLAAAQGQDELAVCLFGAADALREMMEAPLPPSERASFDDFVQVARTRLEIDAFEDAWERGRNLTWPTAIEEARVAAATVGASAGQALT